MFFLLVGEGSSDLGKDSPGPLFVPLMRLVDHASGDMLDYEYVNKSELADYAPAKKPGRQKNMLFRGNKRKFAGLAMVQRIAEALGCKAREVGECGAVYFSDCDYTNREVNNPEMYYEDLVRSMEHGFYSVDGFKNGVPMVPRTRSESWFLCHYSKNPYAACEQYEKLPANDSSPGSGKELLGKYFNCPPTVAEIYARVDSEAVDWLHLTIPSFVFFRKRFEHVVQRLAHVATTTPECDTLMSRELSESLKGEA